MRHEGFDTRVGEAFFFDKATERYRGHTEGSLSRKCPTTGKIAYQLASTTVHLCFVIGVVVVFGVFYFPFLVEH